MSSRARQLFNSTDSKPVAKFLLRKSSDAGACADSHRSRLRRGGARRGRARRPCPPGVIANLHPHPLAFHGYYNQPELTREVLSPIPSATTPCSVYKTSTSGACLEDATSSMGRQTSSQDQAQVELEGSRAFSAATTVGRASGSRRRGRLIPLLLRSSWGARRNRGVRDYAAASRRTYGPRPRLENECRAITARCRARSRRLGARTASERPLPPRTSFEELVFSVWSQVPALARPGPRPLLPLGGPRSRHAVVSMLRANSRRDHVARPLRAPRSKPSPRIRGRAACSHG